MSVPAGTVPTMTDDDATTPPPLVRVRAVLDGEVPNGTHVVAHGTLEDVTVKTNQQTGQWAMGRLVDSDDSIDFWMFPRAFARTGRSSVDTAGPIAVTACVSGPPERTALIINSMERIEPHPEPGVDTTAV
ncbi:hypothetical protein A2J04_22660 [Rhodococcus sp. EPR-279]|nr:hypothetical protein A2J02_22130 [Rhodococcus sp. EPR-147]KZF08955.1 hypothetical protein A2J04_22660 [Rhodococcus sp. EPR-279]